MLYAIQSSNRGAMARAEYLAFLVEAVSRTLELSQPTASRGLRVATRWRRHFRPSILFCTIRNRYGSSPCCLETAKSSSLSRYPPKIHVNLSRARSPEVAAG